MPAAIEKTHTMIKYLPELVKENIISQEIADRITDYYQHKKKQGPNKLFLIFGVLGALLVGIGIILIIAHNWDDFPRNMKVVFAFLPLIVAQVLCGYTLAKKSDSMAWRESTSTFLFLSVGACISLVSQIYHISGNLSTFLSVWMCLCLPVIYLMNSSFTSILFIAGITYYACESGFFSFPYSEPYLYWLLLLLVVPHYLKIMRKSPGGNFVRFHHIIITLSVIISLGTFANKSAELMYIAYFNVFGILLMMDTIPYFQKIKLQDKAFELIGFSGTMVLLFIVSFHWIWEHLFNKHHDIDQLFTAREMIPLIITALIAIWFLYRKYRSYGLKKINPVEFTFLFFILVYVLTRFVPTLAMVCINAAILYLGVTTIINGLRNNRLGIVNFGILIVAILITCRFFDTNFSFLARGFLFVAVGAGFFLTNYRMLKNRRRNEN